MALSSGFLLLSLSSQAGETYRPFDYLDPAIRERPDLQEPVELKLKASPRVSIQSIDVGDVRIRFFSRIAETLQNIAEGRAVPAPQEPIGCALHRSFATSELGPVRLGIAACENALYPERVLKASDEIKVFDWSAFTPEGMRTLEGVIRTAALPLSRTTLPDFIATPELLFRMRGILRKIRYPSILLQLNQAIAGYDGIAGLQELRSELIANRDALIREQELGARIAASERNTVLARGLYRPEFEIPSLTDDDRRWIATYLGAVYWRMRGGGLWNLGGTFLTRYYFNFLSMSAIGGLSGASAGSYAAWGIFLRLFQGWSQWMDIGGNPSGGDQYYDLMKMTERGRRQVDWAAMNLKRLGYDTTSLEIAGLQMGSCYYYGWKVLSVVYPRGVFGTGEGIEPSRPLIDPLGWSELCAGASISLGLTETLLEGKSSGLSPR